ncbi:type II toxin-antitoxin system HicB family antitoxin [Olsenella intestinalis]|uniref:type II toxin-antitoxin system HicB family antitoxin n=1 Tax=Olsenella intestinalis TaxID=2930083 RepID=UPI00200DF83B|nr:type II toxin-antitoxin system HicB family antitoxin [Olsenella intestinalis]
MRYVYDAVIERDEDGYAVSFPQFPEAVTFGATREEASRRAAEVLVLALAERIEEGGEIPSQERVAEVLSVGVEVTGDDIDKSKCLTIDQAAQELGVSAGRVSQLASSGKLTAVTFGKRRMVTIASVNERKANPPLPSRPRKVKTA